MDANERYARLKRVGERIKDELARKEGAKQEVMQNVKDQYGCKTVKAAKVKLTALRKEADEARREADQILAELEGKYGEYLR